MTLNISVTDDQIGKFYRRTAAIAARLGKSLDFGEVMNALQRIHDGKEAKQSPLFSVATITNLDATAGKETSKCFPKPRFVHRDTDLDAWLPKDQPKTDASIVSTLVFKKDWTFREFATAVLGVAADTDVKTLAKLLIENGHTMTLPQAEAMVEKTECGENTELHTNGYGNFFFVETGNEENPVSVGDVSRVGRGWFAHLNSLDYGHRWLADYRFLLRNLLDTSTP